MSIFYFDIADGRSTIPCQGVELGSIADARALALQYAGDMLRDQKSSFWNDGNWTLSVSDGSRFVLFTLAIVTGDAPAIDDAASAARA